MKGRCKKQFLFKRKIWRVQQALTFHCVESGVLSDAAKRLFRKKYQMLSLARFSLSHILSATPLGPKSVSPLAISSPPSDGASNPLSSPAAGRSPLDRRLERSPFAHRCSRAPLALPEGAESISDTDSPNQSTDLFGKRCWQDFGEVSKWAIIVLITA